MSRAIVSRLLLSALILVCAALIVLQGVGIAPDSALPLSLERGAGTYLVHERHDAQVPLPPPLRDGDVLAPDLMGPADRAALFFGINLTRGIPVSIAVRRNGQVIRSQLSPIPASHTGLARIHVWMGSIVAAASMLALALLTLWRGRDWAAWGLFVFSLSILITNAMDVIPRTPGMALWLYNLRGVLETVALLPSLYVTAETLAAGGLSSRARAIGRGALAALTLSLLAANLIRSLEMVHGGVVPPQWAAVTTNGLFLALSALPVLVLLVGYRRAGHEGQLRIRWVLVSTAVLYGTFVIFALFSEQQHPVLIELARLVQIPALVGYLYGVLRSRVVDVSFVIDRALLYALVTALLFGIFALLEQVLHQFALGEKLSWALQAVAALLLAMALSPLHRRLEHGLELMLFRKQRLAVAAVRRLATECAFVERYERLLQIALERLLPYCASAAIYERSVRAYERRAADTQSWVAAVDVDDPLFVTLRAERAPIDLEKVASAVAADGDAFPMMVGEALTGVVICRPRAGEQFAADLRAAFADAARSIGMSLYILRAREQARLVADIASARIDESLARRRALSLMEGAA